MHRNKRRYKLRPPLCYIENINLMCCCLVFACKLRGIVFSSKYITHTLEKNTNCDKIYPAAALQDGDRGGRDRQTDRNRER